MRWERTNKHRILVTSKPDSSTINCSQTIQSRVFIDNGGTMFEEISTRKIGVLGAKKMVKSLFVWLKPSNFSAINTATHQSAEYFIKLCTVDKNKNNSETLEMEDILMPNAQLDAFEIELTPSTIQLLENAEKRQEEVLKWKEVSDEQLRMVVQL
jgi:hypothetical protein